MQVRVFHLASFGQTDGIALTNHLPLRGQLALATIKGSEYPHLISYHQGKAHSMLLKISSKTGEYSFQAPEVPFEADSIGHSPLIHCLYEVWTRYPIAAAVEHHRQYCSKKGAQIHFTVSQHHGYFVQHLKNDISDFIRKSQKPASDRLLSVSVTASSSWDLEDLSEFKFGDWLVGLFCLIPVQIAITQNGQLISLKDGIRTGDFQDEIAGVDVESIANR
jgi:hypothetical protein